MIGVETQMLGGQIQIPEVGTYQIPVHDCRPRTLSLGLHRQVQFHLAALQLLGQAIPDFDFPLGVLARNPAVNIQKFGIQRLDFDGHRQRLGLYIGRPVASH